MTKRAALYLRVSTDNQTTANQRREIEAQALARGWDIVAVYEDAGISGSKGRDRRPDFDRMLKDAVRRKFDVLMVWSVDRLGRSLVDLVNGLQELQGARVDLFLHQQAVDTTTPAGKAMFQMLGVFAEFERSIIVARVKAGLERAKAETLDQRREKGKKPNGRQMLDKKVRAEIVARLASGEGVNSVARQCGVSAGAVSGIKAAGAHIG